jgi:3-oxo-5alpha-steroid 4-dehydrogenase
VGIPSHFYVSGTSLADCVFSGRRAGAVAAAQADAPGETLAFKAAASVN